MGGVIFQTFRRLMQLLPAGFKKRGALTVLLLILNSVLEVLGLGAVIPVVIVVVEEGATQQNEWLKFFYDTIGFSSEPAFILFICISLLVVLLLKNLISVAIAYQQASFTFSLEAYFSKNLFRSFYQKGLPFFKKMNSTKILRNVNSVPNSFANGVVLPMLGLMNEVIIILFILTALVLFDPYVVLFILFIVAPVFAGLYYFSKDRIKKYQEDNHYWSPRLSKVLFEAVYGFMDVKITGTKRTFFRSYGSIKDTIVSNTIRLNTFKVIPQKSIEFTMFLGVVLIIVYGVYNLDSRGELVTLLGVFALAAYRVMPSINRIMIAVMSIKGFQYTIEVMERSDAQESPDMEESATKLQLQHEMSLSNVSFRYDHGNRVVKGVDLTLKKGEVLGIVGPSGSGKTTLMNLMLGFFEPTEGEIFIDNRSLSSDLLESWQRSVGYVSQDVFMVDGTIKENVAFGLKSDEIDEHRVWTCLAMASMRELVESWDEKLETPVGERGGRLSGGQKQRLGIARSLYFGAEVLFFDEATSALDSETEKEITESIQKLSNEDFTMVLIAHRVTTLKFCDRIIEMRDGVIAGEQGYNELIQQTI